MPVIVDVAVEGIHFISFSDICYPRMTAEAATDLAMDLAMDLATDLAMDLCDEGDGFGQIWEK